MKFKPWVLPLCLATTVIVANLLLWFTVGEGTSSLTLWLTLIGLILCGIGLSNGFKLGFTVKEDNQR